MRRMVVGLLVVLAGMALAQAIAFVGLMLPGNGLLTENERATAQVTERPKRGEGAGREMSSGAHM